MPHEMLQYFATQSPPDIARDLLDIFITYYIFYRIALVLKGTRAMQVGLGLVGVFVLYVVAQLLHLHTVLTLLGAVLSSAILIGVVVFQSDIRRGLMRVGAGARLGSTQNLESKVIDAVVDAATTLARHRIGALITFEQSANLDEFVGSHTGITLDAAVTTELLVSLFIPEGMNKLHDGAVVIRDLRVAKAGVFFPMPEGGVKDESFGSRHRAAMGITEETDAVVIVVSEERGSISFCFNGNIIPNLDGPRLRAALDGVFAPKRKKRKQRWSLFKRGVEQDRPSALEPKRSVVDTSASSHTLETLTARLSDYGREPELEETPQPLRKRPSTVDELPSKMETVTREPESAEVETDVSPVGAKVPASERFPKSDDRVSVSEPEAPTPLRKNPQTVDAKPKADETPAPVDPAPETHRTPATPSEPARPMPRAGEPQKVTESTLRPGEGTKDADNLPTEGSAQ